MKKIALAIAITTALSACGSNPESPTLALAQNEVAQMRELPGIENDAAAQYDLANRELDKANRLQEAGRDTELVEHHATMAMKHAQVAQEQFHLNAINREIESADTRRQALLLESSRSQTRDAQAKANAAEARATEANQRAVAAAIELNRLKEEAAVMASELDKLAAAQSERGTVITLKDIVFKTDSAAILEGAERDLIRVAEFLRQYPDRKVRIEGSTDSRGSEQYNQQLSLRRAESVQAILVANGVQADRIETIGLGEAFPVASNETSAGQQKNRRVDIIVAHSDHTDIPPLSAGGMK